jgi:Ca2+-binding EF-hand superfamily protein
MIGSVSSYSTYTSTSSTTTNSTRSQQFQKELLSRLDSNDDGSIDQDELGTALSQKSDDGILVSLSKNFDELDSDGSGDLSSEEMAAMAAPPPPREQAPDTELADALLSALDTDGDGVVSSDELDNGLAGTGSSIDSQQVFSALDTNEDGTVSLEELAASLAPPPPPPQQASGEELFSQLDTDGDGSINASELSSALQADQSTDKSPDQSSVSEALDKMIANLSRQYSLDNVATVGKHLNVAT